MAGKGRPNRILVQEGAPSFVGNIGKIAGAVPVPVRFEEGALGLEPLRAVLSSLSERPGPFWGVVHHAFGRLVSAEALSVFSAHNVPVIELCLGSLQSLASSGPTGAALTIVSLDAEPGFHGISLTALLTSDEGLAKRIRRFCLPGAETRDYVLDASPRGVAEDEAALVGLIDRTISQGVPSSDAPAPPPATAPTSWEAPAPALGFGLSFKRLFQSSAVEAGPGVEEQSPVLPRGAGWLSPLADAEERERKAVRQLEEAMAAAEARYASLAREKNDALDSGKAHLDASQRELALLRERVSRMEADGAAAKVELQAAIEVRSRSTAESQAAAGSFAEREASLIAGADAARKEFSQRLAGLESSLAAVEALLAEETKAKEEATNQIASLGAQVQREIGRASCRERV